MNNRLQKLLKDSQELVIDSSTGEPYDQLSRRKFAELIVNDTIALLRSEWYALNDVQVNEKETARDIGFRVGQKAALTTMMAKINKHFGNDV